MQKPWHELDGKDVLGFFHVDKESGLCSQDIEALRQKFGKNILPQAPTSGVLEIFLRQFFSPLIYLLIIAAAIAFGIGDRRDAFVIVVVVVLNSFIGAIQEGRAQASLVSLRRLCPLKARVIRDGKTSEIDACDLVPGDIFVVGAGDAVPTDGRILEAFALQAAEAALTGESVPVPKADSVLGPHVAMADRCNMLFAGTHVTSGRALLVAVASGATNEIGKIATLASEVQRSSTPLERRLHKFGQVVVLGAVVMFSLVMVLGLIRGVDFYQIFMVAISQMVSLVPEGLPVATTVALAVGVQRMARRRTIVRRLQAVETLGSTTVICADKTGTITRNEMTVARIALPGIIDPIKVSGVGYSPVGDFFDYLSGKKIEDVKFERGSEPWWLMSAAICCNDSRLVQTEDQTSWQVLGDPTEGSLLVCAVKAGLDPQAIRFQSPRKAEWPFDPAIKMMATEHEVDGCSIIFIKGAPEAILPLCADFESTDFTARQDVSCYQDTVNKMAADSLRVLVFGMIENLELSDAASFGDFQGRIKLLGIVGQLDPPRSEVPEAIVDCKSAGIRPVMITGDHPATALAIARDLGLVTGPAEAMSGADIDAMDDARLAQALDGVSVFARVRPEQKLKIVKAFQSRGDVVAMTGDGVNDVPALRQSDVGVAMGRVGTEVAKEASKIVITDDNFATIVAAVAEGRLVHRNLKKLLLFLFVTSVDEVLVLFLGLLFGFRPPLEAVQILWLNLVSETALTVNLIMEPMEGDEMHRPPTPIAEPLLDREMLSRMPLMISVSALATFGWYVFRSSSGVAPGLVQSETFTVLVVSQWFNLLNCRSATKSALSLDLLKNKWLLGGLVAANLLHGLVIYAPPFSKFFHTQAISPSSFFAIGLVSSLVLWGEELRKIYARRGCRQARQSQ